MLLQLKLGMNVDLSIIFLNGHLLCSWLWVPRHSALVPEDNNPFSPMFVHPILLAHPLLRRHLRKGGVGGWTKISSTATGRGLTRQQLKRDKFDT